MNTVTKTLTLSLTLAAGLAAQGGQFNRTVNFGTADWGGSFTVLGSANYSDVNTNFLTRVQTGDLNLAAGSTVRLDGRAREAFAISAFDDSTITSNFDLATRATSRTARLSQGMNVRVNGNTVFSYTSTSTAARSVDLLPLNLFGSNGFNETVQVGPYGVTLRMNASSDVNATVTPRLSTATLTAGLNLASSVQEQGSASASLSVLGVSVGVDALLDLADPSTSLDLSTNFRSATAVASWAVGIIRTHLDVFARAFGLEWRLPIIHLDIPGFSGSLTAIL